MSSDSFVAVTSSTAIGRGDRVVELSPDWNTPLGKPNGGYQIAVVLRALMAEFDQHDPLVLATSFLASPAPGNAQLHCEDIRRGGTIHTARGRMTQGERIITDSTINFAVRRTGRSTELGEPPLLDSPEKLVDPFNHGFERTGMFSHLDYRLSQVPGWAVGEPNQRPQYELWQRVRGVEQHDYPALALLCDSFAPPVMELGEFASVTVQLTLHLHRVPVPGWIATRIQTRHLANGFHEEDCELWDEAGNLVAQSRQLSILLS